MKMQQDVGQGNVLRNLKKENGFRSRWNRRL